MFFSISQQPDHRFYNRLQHGNLWIGFDDGWRAEDHDLVKGYDSNWCRLRLTDQGVSIQHSQPRSFPLWFEHGFITNLHPESGQQAWARDSLHINNDGHIVWTPLELDLSVPDTVITVDQAQQLVCAQLDNSVKELGSQSVRLFCSGGLDTFLIYALLRYHDCDFDLTLDDYFEFDPFTIHNQMALQQHWSYKPQQINHWKKPTWLATGGCGDEYFLRGPAVIAMLTAWHDIDFGTILSHSPDQYHYYHFSKYQQLWTDSWNQRHQLQGKFATKTALIDHVMDHLVNDHQHWHLGNTITWTPLKNIEIVKVLLQCDIHDLMPQFLNGNITRSIIKHYEPAVLRFVSDFKNHNTDQYIKEFERWHHA